MNKKLIVVIEVEMEKDVPGIEREICQRIAMHPHVRDANPLSIGASLEDTHAPKSINVNVIQNMRGMGISSAEAAKITERLLFNGGML